MSDAEELTAVLLSVRDAVREAHGALKDLRAEIRAARVYEAKLGEDMVQQRVHDVLTRLVGEMEEGIERQIGIAQKAVDNRFDLIASIMLGEDYEAKNRGQPPIAELIRRHVILHPEDAPRSKR